MVGVGGGMWGESGEMDVDDEGPVLAREGAALQTLIHPQMSVARDGRQPQTRLHGAEPNVSDPAVRVR